MFTRTTAAQLAARVRSIVGGDDRPTLSRTAIALGIAEGDLREIVLHATVYPSISVLAAIVAYYGVDAGWLLTGDYSPSAHRDEEELGEPPMARIARHLEVSASPDPWVARLPLDRTIDDIVAAESTAQVEKLREDARLELAGHPRLSDVEQIANAKRALLQRESSYSMRRLRFNHFPQTESRPDRQ